MLSDMIMINCVEGLRVQTIWRMEIGCARLIRFLPPIPLALAKQNMMCGGSLPQQIGLQGNLLELVTR